MQVWRIFSADMPKALPSRFFSLRNLIPDCPQSRPFGGRYGMDPKDIDMFRELLNNMLQDILRKGEETIEDMTDTVEVYADPADRATAESDRAFTLRLRDRERRLIKKINAAIERIEDGTFGECVECGEDISVPRLKARPVTTLCIKCKSKQEAEEDIRGE